MTSQRASTIAAAAVLSHFVVNVVHGIAHAALDVWLSPAQTAYVAIVILVAPFAALALVSRARRAAGALLAISMLGALAFGTYKHFLEDGPDHCANLVPGPWADLFTVTAVLLAISEILGAAVGARLWATDAAIARDHDPVVERREPGAVPR